MNFGRRRRTTLPVSLCSVSTAMENKHVKQAYRPWNLHQRVVLAGWRLEVYCQSPSEKARGAFCEGSCGTLGFRGVVGKQPNQTGGIGQQRNWNKYSSDTARLLRSYREGFCEGMPRNSQKPSAHLLRRRRPSAKGFCEAPLEPLN